MDEYKPMLVELANSTALGLTGRFSEVQAIIEGCDIIFAVWQDPTAGSGVGVHLIKGRALLRDTASGGSAVKMRFGAIPCVSAEQAAALLKVAGDKADH